MPKIQWNPNPHCPYGYKAMEKNFTFLPVLEDSTGRKPVHIRALKTTVSTMHFLTEIMVALKAIKFNFKGSCDEKNLTLVVISYEIYETRQRLVL